MRGLTCSMALKLSPGYISWAQCRVTSSQVMPDKLAALLLPSYSAIDEKYYSKGSPD